MGRPVNALRAAWRRWLARHAPTDPAWSDLGRLDVLDGRRAPIVWQPRDIAPQAPARPAGDVWADDPDRTTRRDTYSDDAPMATVRKIARAARAGLITDAEAAIDIAAVYGVDIRCVMGECPHAPRA